MSATYFGRYELIEKIGQGGFAEVWRARDLLYHDVEVALKILRSDRDSPEARRRLLNEGKALQKLTHPGIVAYRGTEAHQGRFGLAQELVTGGTLEMRLRDTGVLPAADVVAIGRGAAEALAAAHGIGLVHRDIKPGNLLLTPEGRVKVADFGLVKDLAAPPQDHLTHDGDQVGTYRYMSPEQIRAEHLDARSDIFSLAVTLYEAATGIAPFRGATVAELRKDIGGADPFLRPEAGRIDPVLAAVLRRAMAKSVTERYPDMSTLANDLSRLGAAAAPAMPGAVAQPGAVVARAVQFSRLQEMLQRATAPGGHGLTALVSGEAGVGKTTLIDEFVRRASATIPVPHGVASFREGRSGYRPVAEALAGFLDRAGTSDAALAREALRASIASGPPAHRPKRFAELLDQALTQAARAGPFLLVLENLHEAGADAIAALRVMVAAMRSTQGLLVISHRSDAQGRSRDVQGYLDWVLGERLAEEVHLDRFTREETRELLAALLPAAAALEAHTIDELQRASEGNPLFVCEMVRYHLDTGRLTPEGKLQVEPPLPIPKTIRDVIRRRLEKLAPDLVRLLEAAAIEGEVFHTDVAAALVGWGRARTLSAIRSLVRDHGLLVPLEREYRFHHGQIAEVIAEGILPEVRADMHRRVAKLLAARRPPPSGDVARHMIAAGQRADALPHLLAAGRKARAHGATREAGALYRSAAQILEGSARGTRRYLEVLYTLGEVGDSGPSGGEAASALETVAAEAMAYPDLRGRAIHDLGWIRLRSGDLAAARREFRLALKSFERAGNRKWAAACHDALGVAYRHEGDLARALREARIALAARRRIGFAWGVALSRSNLGVIHFVAGDLAKALISFEGVCAYFRKAKKNPIEVREKLATALSNTGVVSTELGKIERGLECYREALSIKVAVGDVHGEAMTRINLGDAYAVIGLTGAAADAHEHAARLARDAGNTALHSHALRGRGSVRLAEGKAGEARELLDQALSEARLSGDAEAEARAGLERTRCRLQLGEVKEASRELEETAALIARRGLRGLEAQALHLRGRVEERLLDLAAAVAAYRRALRILGKSPQPELRWRLQRDLAALLARDRRTRPEAVRLRREAIAQLRSIEERIRDLELHRAYAAHPERARFLANEGETDPDATV